MKYNQHGEENTASTHQDKHNYSGVELTPELIEAFDEFRRIDRRIKRIKSLYENCEYDEGFTECKMVLRCVHERAADQADARNHLARVLHDGIDGLSDIQQRVITSCYFEGFTQKEIAAKEGLSQSSISRHMSNAMQILRRYILQMD